MADSHLARNGCLTQAELAQGDNLLVLGKALLSLRWALERFLWCRLTHFLARRGFNESQAKTGEDMALTPI